MRIKSGDSHITDGLGLLDTSFQISKGRCCHTAIDQCKEHDDLRMIITVVPQDITAVRSSNSWKRN